MVLGNYWTRGIPEMQKCNNLLAPREDDFIHYVLDDIAFTPEIQSHVKGCAICQQELRSYQTLESSLTAKLYRSQCPSATQLNFFCANMLPSDDVMQITAHLKRCPLCAHEAKELRRLLANFDPFPAGPPKFEMLRQIVASFIPMKPVFVTRGAGEEVSDLAEADNARWPRQYRADDINISLHLSRSSSGELMLLGLFSGDDLEELEGAEVRLYETTALDARLTPLMTTRIDDLGNVAFKAIPGGDYGIIVSLTQREVTIKNLLIPNN
jgi:hypothetical protein